MEKLQVVHYNGHPYPMFDNYRCWGYELGSWEVVIWKRNYDNIIITYITTHSEQNNVTIIFHWNLCRTTYNMGHAHEQWIVGNLKTYITIHSLMYAQERWVYICISLQNVGTGDTKYEVNCTQTGPDGTTSTSHKRRQTKKQCRPCRSPTWQQLCGPCIWLPSSWTEPSRAFQCDEQSSIDFWRTSHFPDRSVMSP